MSTNSQRLVSAIRRLAKTDPDISNAIDATKNRGGYDGEGAKAESTGANAGRICCDGSTGALNPGASSRSPDEEGAGQDASGGLDPNDPAKLDMGGGGLTGLTDCTTGEPVCFEGSDWLPPEGWDSPTERPIDPGWEEGTFVCRGPAHDCNGFYYTPQAMCDSYEPGLYPDPVGEDVNGDMQYTCTYGEGGVAVGTGRRRECGINETNEVCANPDPPLAQYWPVDGCVNLAVKGGALVGSRYDPENDGSYSAPMAEVQLCDDNGNQIGIRPSADGGWKSVDLVNGGDGYLYNAQGEQVARVSGDEYSDPAI